MPHKILVVDDSALMRKYLTQIFSKDASFEVHTARNGKHALEQIERVDPDLVTLDINMPEMDGLTCLSKIMSSKPRPVIMVSSLTEKGAIATFEALELGAVDYIPKPGGSVSLNLFDIQEVLMEKVRAALGARVRARPSGPPKPRPAASPLQEKRRARMQARAASGGQQSGLVLVGVSTGGPSTLERIVSGLPSSFPWPILIAQHMPGTFTRVLSEHLGRASSLQVQEVVKPTELKPGFIYIARGDADVVVRKKGTTLIAESVTEDKSYRWHPSVDRLVKSALECVPPEQLIAVQLTGMGYDGAETMAELKEKGGKTIAESEETAVVFGMPRELIKRNGATVTLACEAIGSQLVSWVKTAGLRSGRSVG